MRRTFPQNSTEQNSLIDRVRQSALSKIAPFALAAALQTADGQLAEAKMSCHACEYTYKIKGARGTIDELTAYHYDASGDSTIKIPMKVKPHGYEAKGSKDPHKGWDLQLVIEPGDHVSFRTDDARDYYRHPNKPTVSVTTTAPIVEEGVPVEDVSISYDAIENHFTSQDGIRYAKVQEEIWGHERVEGVRANGHPGLECPKSLTLNLSFIDGATDEDSNSADQTPAHNSLTPSGAPSAATPSDTDSNQSATPAQESDEDIQTATPPRIIYTPRTLTTPSNLEDAFDSRPVTFRLRGLYALVSDAIISSDNLGRSNYTLNRNGAGNIGLEFEVRNPFLALDASRRTGSYAEANTVDGTGMRTLTSGELSNTDTKVSARFYLLPDMLKEIFDLDNSDRNSNSSAPGLLLLYDQKSHDTRIKDPLEPYDLILQENHDSYGIGLGGKTGDLTLNALEGFFGMQWTKGRNVIMPEHPFAIDRFGGSWYAVPEHSSMKGTQLFGRLQGLATAGRLERPFVTLDGMIEGYGGTSKITDISAYDQLNPTLIIPDYLVKARGLRARLAITGYPSKYVGISVAWEGDKQAWSLYHAGQLLDDSSRTENDIQVGVEFRVPISGKDEDSR